MSLLFFQTTEESLVMVCLPKHKLVQVGRIRQGEAISLHVRNFVFEHRLAGALHCERPRSDDDDRGKPVDPLCLQVATDRGDNGSRGPRLQQRRAVQCGPLNWPSGRQL